MHVLGDALSASWKQGGRHSPNSPTDLPWSPMTPANRMEFMSPEHVAVMNERLRAADDVRVACRGLDQPRVMLFRLRTGPDKGRDIFWTLTYEDTMQFALDEHTSPDIILTGEWQTMVRAVQAARVGEPAAPDLQMHGDPEVFAQLNEILDIARPVATLDTAIPDA